jgi:HK97 family phage portal protein
LNFFDRLLGRKAAQLTYDQVANLIDGNGGGIVAGVAVNEKTALQVSTVLACVKAIADGCATPPMHVYRELANGTRQKATNIPEYRLLSRRPNAWQTSFEWRRQMTLHAALTGTGLSIKVRGGNGRVTELLPVEPGRWDVRKVNRYELRYRCYDEFGLIGDFGPDDVFVINGLQWDWHESLNAITLAKAAIGLSIATERSQSAMHANGLKTSGTYSVDGILNPEAHERLSAWLKRKAGPDNAGTPLVLDRNAKWQSTAITGVDAQHLETRKMQVEEICRCYGVFPLMVGSSDKTSTFASSEAFFAAHLKHTLAPWHMAWTQRIDEMLLDGAGPLFAEFDTRYLTSGSMVDRAQWMRTAVEMGIYTRNEIRDYEGLDPIDGLDEVLVPLNMATPGQQPANDADKGSLLS